MEILDLRVVNGPNIWSDDFTKLVIIKPGFTRYDRDSVQNLLEKAKKNLPEEAVPKQLQDDPYLQMSLLIAQVALALQPKGTYTDARLLGKNAYYAIFGYTEETAGMEAARLVIEMITEIEQNKKIAFEKAKEKVLKAYSGLHPGPTTQTIIDAALRRHIPVSSIGNGKFIVLGHGIRQKKFEASIVETTGSISVNIASDKDTTKQLLAEVLIPVPEGVCINDEDQLKETFQKLGPPLLTKPLDGHQGQGITADIQDEQTLLNGFRMAKEYSSKIIVERFVKGNDYRFLVIGYKLVAAAHRVPAFVTGDGFSTIKELIDEVNKNPSRGLGHENILTTIKTDEHTMKILEEKNLTLDSVLLKDEILYLKQTANLSTGGIAIDVTDEVHPENILLAEKAARIIGLDICGIDIMAPDIKPPITANGGVILEVNAAPGLRMHIAPSIGKPRNVGDPIVDLLHPTGSQSRVPIVAITGTNGKTTTTRLMAALATNQGFHTGFTCTDGIFVNGIQVKSGDCSGPKSASVVLHDPTVDFAVLECARGGIVRSGLAFDHCDIGIVTNVAEDHLGLKDIYTLDDMAHVKSTVPKSVARNGYAILNANDDKVYNMRKGLKCKVALFSIDSKNPRISQHIAAGGIVAVMDENRNIVVMDGKEDILIENVMNIPLTMNGAAGFMIENILPVVLASHLLGFSMDGVRQMLRSLRPSDDRIPGRMNIFSVSGVNVIVDYAHNPHGLKALGDMLQKIEAPKTGIIAGVGDRRDEDITEVGRTAAAMYDKVIIRTDADTRGRAANDIESLLVKGLKEVKPQIDYKVIPRNNTALEFAIENANKGEYVVISAEKVDDTINYVKTLQSKYGK